MAAHAVPKASSTKTTSRPAGEAVATTSSVKPKAAASARSIPSNPRAAWSSARKNATLPPMSSVKRRARDMKDDESDGGRLRRIGLTATRPNPAFAKKVRLAEQAPLHPAEFRSHGAEFPCVMTIRIPRSARCSGLRP